MVYEIKISLSDNLQKRCYISITFNNKRYKEYNGNSINLNIFPNKAKSLKDRNRLLKLLEYEYRKQLEKGEYQQYRTKTVDTHTAVNALYFALDQKKQLNLSEKYIAALAKTHNEFIDFLTEQERHGDINALTKVRIQQFLNVYKPTPTYYMHKRKELTSLFSYLKNNQYIKENPALGVEKLKLFPTLHKIYNNKQLNDVLCYLKEKHENLYLCCL